MATGRAATIGVVSVEAVTASAVIATAIGVIEAAFTATEMVSAVIALDSPAPAKSERDVATAKAFAAILASAEIRALAMAVVSARVAAIAGLARASSVAVEDRAEAAGSAEAVDFAVVARVAVVGRQRPDRHVGRVRISPFDTNVITATPS